MSQLEIHLEKPGTFIQSAGEVPDLPSGHARVRIRRIGVCGTDIHAFHGRQPFFEYPRILGHELGAEIVEVNGDSDFRPGEAVTLEPYLNNPESPASRKGKTNCCEDLQVLGIHCDGGMRPLISVPLHKLHRAASASMDQLALVEMLCIGQHAANRSGLSENDTALVIGTGPIGMSVLQFVRAITPNVVVADLDESRLAFCREALGIEQTIRITPESDMEKELRDRFGGELPGTILDATGNRHSMAGTFDCIAHGGTIVMVGLFQGDLAFNDPNFHRREVTLKASRNATSAEFGQVIAAIEAGKIDTDPWITHRMELAEVPDQFAKITGAAGMRKAVIEVND